MEKKLCKILFIIIMILFFIVCDIKNAVCVEQDNTITTNTWIDVTEENSEEQTSVYYIQATSKNYNGTTPIGWLKKFLTSPIGTIANFLLDILRNMADSVQIAINLVQTLAINTAGDWSLKYSEKNLKKDAKGTYKKKGSGNRDAYTNISDSYEEDESQWTYNVHIEDYGGDGSEYLFEKTRIPIIYVDIYTMAANKVNFLDVNFLSVNENHAENSVWMKLRNFVAGFIRSSYYVAAAILIIALIWYGIQIVSSSFNNPGRRAESQEGLERFIGAVAMLVGTILIMALSIYSYKALLGDIAGEDEDYELPIRVHFIQDWDSWWGLAASYDNEYSFSTNITGYIRFMAEIENPDMALAKAGYVVCYIFLVVINAFVLVFMIIRMIVMWVLSMVGPMIATLYAINSTNKNKDNNKVMEWYKAWVKLYIMMASIQVVFATASRVILESLTLE